MVSKVVHQTAKYLQFIIIITGLVVINMSCSFFEEERHYPVSSEIYREIHKSLCSEEIVPSMLLNISGNSILNFKEIIYNKRYVLSLIGLIFVFMLFVLFYYHKNRKLRVELEKIRSYYKKEKKRRAETEELLYLLNRQLEEANSKQEIDIVEYKENLYAMLNSIGDGTIITDEKGKIIKMNSIAEEFTGWKYKDAKGKSIHTVYNIVQSETGKSCNNLINTVLKTGDTKRRNNHKLIICKDGSERNISDFILPIYDKKNITGVIVSFTDTTEKVNYEKETKQIFDQTLAMFNAFDEIVYVADPNTYELVFTNNTFNRIWGTSEETKGKKCYEVLQNRKTPCPFCTNYIIFEKEPEKQYTWEIQNLSNKKWYRCTDKAIDWPDGRKLRFEIAMDISQLKIQERRFKESEQRLKAAMSAANIGLWDWNIANGSLYTNNEWKTILGYSAADEKIGKLASSFFNLLHPDDKENVSEKLNKYLSGEIDEYKFEIRMLCADGTYKWIFTEGINVEWDEEKKPSRMIGVHIDITERKLQEERITLANNAANSALRLAKAGTWYIDYIKYPDRFIVDDRLLEIQGEKLPKGVNYLLNQEWYKNIASVDPEFAKKVRLDASEVTANPMLSDLDVTFPYLNKKLNKQIWLRSISNIQRNEKGVAVKAYGVTQDITEQVKYEQEIARAKEEAEAASIAKSAFLANMSHEIRTPMNAIIGFSEILCKQIKEPSHIKYLQSIKLSGKTLLNIINDILDISKIEAGRIEIQKEPVSINVIFEELASMFCVQMKQKGIKFVRTLDEKFPGYIELDELRLRQVLINLTSNALKFTESGKVEIEVLALNKTQGKVDVEINVKDTGIGISHKDTETIFESFQQVENQDTRKYGGTGLGLAISNKIIKLFGGTITVDSKKGQGSTFTIHLPGIKIIEDSEVEISPDFKYTPDSLVFSKAKVLVVDDIEDNREVVKGYLSPYGITIVEAENGEQAVDVAKEIIPDLIFMDLRMPEMNGYQATDILRSEKNTSKIPIVALTASVFVKKQQDIFDKGFNGYLRKPVQLIELVNELTNFLSFKEIVKSTGKEYNKDTALIPHKYLDNINEIKNELLLIKKEYWDRIQHRQPITEVNRFKDRLGLFINQYEIPAIKEYFEKLEHSIGDFDIETIKKLVQKFPLQINKLFGN